MEECLKILWPRIDIYDVWMLTFGPLFMTIEEVKHPATKLSWILVPSGDNDSHRELTLKWK